MLTNHPVKVLIAVVLVAAAIVAATQVGFGSGGARADTPAKRVGVNAAPPALRLAGASELAAMRQSEAARAGGLLYGPRASARYSMAELNAYARDHR